MSFSLLGGKPQENPCSGKDCGDRCQSPEGECPNIGTMACTGRCNSEGDCRVRFREIYGQGNFSLGCQKNTTGELVYLKFPVDIWLQLKIKLTFCLFPSNVIWIYYVDYILIKTDYECKSSDQSLGEFASLEECANACKNIAGCHFFVYGKETNQGPCYWEKTSDSSCPEGWILNKYDFYELTSKFSFYLFYSWPPEA